MTPTNRSLEEAITNFLQKRGPCYLDDLTLQLSEYSWNELFVALDHMSRKGRVTLRRYPKSGYHISLPSQRPSPSPMAELPS